MQELVLSIGEPFTSPAWGSNFVLFSGEAAAVIPEEESKAYLRRTCAYAKHYGVYLIPQRFSLMGYDCLCLISPLGKVVGAQRNTHLHMPAKAGQKRSGVIEVLSTEFGGISLCVDVDIYRPEYAHIAARLGARYLFCVQQMTRADYSTHMVLTGIWNAAQSNNLFAVSVSNQFHAVCAPRIITPNEDGFLAKPTLKTPLMVHMDADDLKQCPRQRPLSRKLYAVHRRELV